MNEIEAAKHFIPPPPARTSWFSVDDGFSVCDGFVKIEVLVVTRT
jgi:hypothetical protein